MRHVTFYHEETGVLNGVSLLVSDDAAVALNERLYPRHKVIDHPPGHTLDRLSQRVDVATGAVVDYQPPQPSSDHAWNADTRRWQLIPARAEQQTKRAAALAEIARLEASQARSLREAFLGRSEAVEQLRAIDAQIAALREQIGA